MSTLLPTLLPTLPSRPLRAVGPGLAALVLLGGCGGGDDAGPSAVPSRDPVTSSSPTSLSPTSSASPSGVTSSPAASPTTTTPEGGAANAALVAAGALVADRVSGSRVVSVESGGDGDDDWDDVTVATATGATREASVAPDGTSLLAGPRAEDDDREDRAEHVRLLRGAGLDLAAAVAAVEAEVAGGRITEIDLDSWRGRVVWEAEVAGAGEAEQTVRVDARSGGAVGA